MWAIPELTRTYELLPLVAFILYLTVELEGERVLKRLGIFRESVSPHLFHRDDIPVVFICEFGCSFLRLALPHLQPRGGEFLIGKSYLP